jgi:cytochrome bd-type quinol oxidase subunit 1
MRVAEGVTPQTSIGLVLFTFLFLYLALTVGLLMLLMRPAPAGEETSVAQGDRHVDP